MPAFALVAIAIVSPQSTYDVSIPVTCEAVYLSLKAEGHWLRQTWKAQSAEHAHSAGRQGIFLFGCSRATPIRTRAFKAEQNPRWWIEYYLGRNHTWLDIYIALNQSKNSGSIKGRNARNVTPGTSHYWEEAREQCGNNESNRQRKKNTWDRPTFNGGRHVVLVKLPTRFSAQGKIGVDEHKAQASTDHGPTHGSGTNCFHNLPSQFSFLSRILQVVSASYVRSR